MSVRLCVICKAAIWHTEGGLCLEHRRFAEEWSAVAAGKRSDWDDGRLLSHKEMQLQQPNTGASWLTVLDDINRMARYWLDGWHGGDNESGGIAA